MSEDATSNDELSSADSLENNQQDNNRKRRQNPLKNGGDDLDSDFELQFDVKGDALVTFDDATERSLTATDSEKSTALPTAVNGNEQFYHLAFLEANHADCNQRISTLIEQVNDLRAREAALVQEVEILKKVVEDFQSQPPSHLFSTYNDTSDLSCSVSPRSDRSLSTHINTIGIQYALDVFGENNRLLQDGLNSKRRTDKTIRKMQAQIDELESNLKNAEERYQHLIEEYANKETIFMEQILQLQKNLIDARNSFESLMAEKAALSEQYNELLMQKSNWQSKIDELKNIRRSQAEVDEEIERLRSENENLSVQLRSANDKANDLSVNLTNTKSLLADKTEEVAHFRRLLNEKAKEDYKLEYEELTKQYKLAVNENERLADELLKANAKLETLSQIERAFESQNLGLSTLKKSLESKETNLNEMKRRCKDLEQVLDENLREREHKSTLVLQLQEQLNKKSTDFDKLEQDFDSWKTNANAQFEHTCREYDEKIEGLHKILQRYTDYPGKVDEESETKSKEISKLIENIEVLERQLEDTKMSYEKTAKLIEDNAKTKYHDMCQKYEAKINELQMRLKKYQIDSSKIPAELKAKENEIEDCRRTIEDLNRQLDEALSSRDLSFETFKLNAESKYIETNRMWENKVAELEKTVTALSQRLAQPNDSGAQARIIEINEMTEELARLTVRCERSDLLHYQATETIQTLRDQYDEERKLNERLSNEIEKLTDEIERLRRDKINAVNEANVSAYIYKIVADRVRLGDGRLDVSLESLLTGAGDDANSLRLRLTKVTEEKRDLQVEIYRQKSYRRSLICQKKYLLSVIDELKLTEMQALNFMKKNGYSSRGGDAPRDIQKTPLSKFRRCLSAVIASIRLRKKREKICKYLNRSTLSPYPLSVSF